MKVNTIQFLLFIIIIFIASSCKKDSVIAPEDMGYGYFPLNIGHTVTYEADSIQYTLGANDSIYVRKSAFQLKDVISSTFYDNSNRLTYIFERFYRHPDSLNWIPLKVCTANREAANLQWKEDNYTYINLVFPVKLKKVWDGNSYNILDESEFKYTEIDESYSYKTLSADSTLTVLQKDELNGLETHFMLEKYSKHIGMVYKENIYHQKNLSTGELTGGYEFRMKAISYSN